MGSAPVTLEVTRRESAFGGQVFGAVGAYEWIYGQIAGAVDPSLRQNRRIALLADAPRNADGQVAYRADFAILKPVQMQSGNRQLLYDVLNRGEQKALSCFNEVSREVNLRGSVPVGNGFLMRRGYTLVWSAWQGDVTDRDLLMCADFPVAQRRDGPLVALSREEFIFDNEGAVAAVAALTYPAHSLNPADARLSARRNNREPAEVLSNQVWRYLSPRRIQIERPENFDAGTIFEFVYPAKDPIVLGLGFAAIRDTVSHLRYGLSEKHGTYNPLAEGSDAPAIDHTIAFGTSQSGRLLRDLLWQGFNEDLDGRRVFDGMLIDGAGSRKSFVNAAFGQPGRFSRQHEDHVFPGDDFPFTYAVRQEEEAGRVDGLLEACEASNTCPKIIHTDSSSEYWQARAALIASDLQGTDFELPPVVRAYLYSSLQHGGAFARPVPFCSYPVNSLSDAPLHRALLSALDDWVVAGRSPPDSRIPRTSDGTLVSAHPQSVQGFPFIPGVSYPLHANELSNWDHSAVPPERKAGVSYAPLVPKVDQDGNDIAGIRLPAITAPLGTHTGWNIRRAGYGAGELASVRGSFFPFAPTKARREAAADPRPSLEERYPGRSAYVMRVTDAARTLCRDRLLLEEDVARFTAAAMKLSAPIPAAQTRVPILTREDLAAGDRDIYDDYERVRKTPPSVIHRTIANAPAVLRAYMPISNQLRFGTQLSARLRELVIVTVGHVTGSIYEVEAHTRFALQAGARPEQLEALCDASVSSVYDESERAAILYASEVTQRHGVQRGTFAALKSRFDAAGIVEIALQVGFYNTVIRILGAFGIESSATAHDVPSEPRRPFAKARQTDPQALTALQRELGEDFEGRVFTAMNAAPALAHAYFAFGTAVVSGAGIDPALRELVVVVVLETLGADAMAARHRDLAARMGVSASKLQGLAAFEVSVEFSEPERAALRFALRSAGDIHVAGETFRSLHRWFDLRATVGLTLLIAYYAGLALIAIPLDAQPE